MLTPRKTDKREKLSWCANLALDKSGLPLKSETEELPPFSSLQTAQTYDFATKKKLL